MVKNSFTLIETLLSITLLLVVIGGFYQSTIYDEKNQNSFTKLNNLENRFDSKNYEGFAVSSKTLDIKINNTQTTLNVNKYEYFDEHIKIYKYEK